MESGDKIVNLEQMVGISGKVIPERIKEARIYRGYTQQDLSQKLGITRQAVCSYESKANTPSLETMMEISKILNFPLNFFYKKRVVCNEQGEVYFRSSSIPAKTKEMLEQKLDLLATEIADFLCEYIRLPELDLIDVPYKEEYTSEDIIKIVHDLRNHWNLGNKPISNLTYLMQEKGCVIARIFLDSQKTDGYSKWMWNRPFTFLNTEKNAAVRARFTLAHELGHIILHRNLRPGEDIKKRERESNFFAGEFLYPTEAVLEELSFITLDSLVPIKAKWGVSVGVLIRRCLDLGLITEDRYTILQKQMSKRKWRTFEPLDDLLEIEQPQLFKEAFTLLDENNILNKKEILDVIAFDKNELVQLCCLPQDFFGEPQLTIKPKFQVIK